ncbi:MAG: glycosyltransferase [Synechococcales bacterium]|nr:glycosyltransferase [Synechococcales bacterium]
MPKVSVIIAAYNAMTYLPKTLDSVFAQTFQDFEVIVIDDGSRDNIKQWAEHLTDPRVQFLSQENSGSAAARNTGLAKASGTYIAFLDADDLWEPTKLAKQVNVLDTDPQAGLVYSWVATIDADDQPQGKVCQNSEEGNVWPRLIEHDLIECGSNPMIRACCFDKVGNFDTSFPYAQTWEMWLRIAAAYPFRVIPEPLVSYRFHPGNTSKQWQKMETNYQAIIEKVFADAPEEYQHLKARAYGFAYLRIAWKTLQNLGGDCRTARKFRQQAFIQCPEVRFTDQAIRLSLAIPLVQIFGLDGYNRVRASLHHLKHRITRLPKALIFSS